MPQQNSENNNSMAALIDISKMTAAQLAALRHAQDDLDGAYDEIGHLRNEIQQLRAAIERLERERRNNSQLESAHAEIQQLRAAIESLRGARDQQSRNDGCEHLSVRPPSR